MTHERTPQSHESTEAQQRKAVSALNRRDFLKHSVVAGSVSVTALATGTAASAAESPDDGPTHETTEDIPATSDDHAGTPFDKSLVVEGIEDGINYYQFSINDAITAEEVVKARLRGNDKPLITGEVQMGDIEVYSFNGKVTDVSARGSIAYHVYE